MTKRRDPAHAQGSQSNESAKHTRHAPPKHVAHRAPLLDDYSGPFEPGFHLDRLSRATLGRLGREYMLFAHFHDRGLMPLIGRRFTPAAMTAVACDEWIGSSPVYNPRVRRLLGIEGDGVSAILKAFQLDIGFPHQYMDVRYELVDETRGYFWLAKCGALADILRISPNNEQAIIQLCHHMEDPTFPATVTSVNRRARIVAEHRPPLQIGHTGPDCRWRVEIAEHEEVFEPLAITDVVRQSRAGRFTYAPLEGDLGPGLHDYAGPFEPDFVLEDLAQPVLARQLKEIALDAHLLMRASFESIRDRFGADPVPGLARDQWAGIAPVVIPRLRACLRIEGNDMSSILKTLQIDPALPHDYVRFGAQLLDERHGRFWIEDCEAMAPGEPDAWTARLGDEEHPGLQPVVAAVNPQARLSPLDPELIDAGPAVLAWEIRIDPDEEPFAESPIANIVRISNVSRFSFRDS